MALESLFPALSPSSCIILLWAELISMIRLRGYYSVRLKGRKCYKYLWWFLFDIAITNAYILSKHYFNLTIRSVKMFRTDLAKQLIGNFNNQKRPGCPSLLASSKRICSDHFPRKLEKRRKCHLCYTKKKRTDTIWVCPSYNIALCQTGNDDSDCFLKYHQ